MPTHRARSPLFPLLVALALPCAPAAADVVTEWNRFATETIAAANGPAPAAYRAVALVQTAVHEAVVAVAERAAADPEGFGDPFESSIPAAVAAANEAVLVELLPSGTDAIAERFRSEVARLRPGPARDAGLAAGRDVAHDVLARRAIDRVEARETWRPETEPGRYVPTALPVAQGWPGRTPWNLARADELRPAPPPDLASALWARDYAEIQALGARTSSARTPEQTEGARFWEATQPPVYFAVVRSVAELPGRDPVRNARLLAVVAQAMDDALIAVFDAKYHYAFWRPITAIRNGDRDGVDATQRDPSWLPFVETPMHPEYPAAHCGLAGAVAAVLQAELGGAPTPVLRSTSPTLPGVERRWTTLDAFVRDVAEARICDGVHFRNSTAVGTAIGRKAAERALERFDAARARTAR